MPSAVIELAPALAETLLICALGYISARLNLLPKQTTGCLSWFASYIALPAMIFQGMATIKIGAVDFNVVWAIALAKTTLFVVTLLVNAFLNKDKRAAWAIAGIRAIFVEQSNDLALGVPIVNALYSVTHPLFINYEFLFPVVSLVFLNPIGFILLEVGTRHRKKPTSGCRLICGVLRRVITNPIVLVVILGLAWNLIIGPSVPSVFNLALTTMAGAFDSVALFTLGSSMVGLLDVLSLENLLTPLVLVALKIIVAPILSIFFSNLLGVPGDLALYTFIYGTLPTAPAVFVWAKLHRVGSKVTAVAVLMSTVLAAPVMLVSAQMASVHLSDKSTALAVAEVTWKTMHDASWVTFGCALWVLLFACLLPRTSHRNVLVNLTRLLCFAEIMQALATVVCPTSILSSRSLMYLRFSAMYFGILASRFYAAALVSGFALSLSWGESAMRRYRYLLYLVPLLAAGAALLGSMSAGDWEDNMTAGHECAGGFGKGEDTFSIIALMVVLVTFCVAAMQILVRKVSTFPLASQLLPKVAIRKPQRGNGGAAIPGLELSADLTRTPPPASRREEEDLARPLLGYGATAVAGDFTGPTSAPMGGGSRMFESERVTYQRPAARSKSQAYASGPARFTMMTELLRTEPLNEDVARQDSGDGDGDAESLGSAIEPAPSADTDVESGSRMGHAAGFAPATAHSGARSRYSSTDYNTGPAATGPASMPATFPSASTRAAAAPNTRVAVPTGPNSSGGLTSRGASRTARVTAHGSAVRMMGQLGPSSWQSDPAYARSRYDSLAAVRQIVQSGDIALSVTSNGRYTAHRRPGAGVTDSVPGLSSVMSLPPAVSQAVQRAARPYSTTAVLRDGKPAFMHEATRETYIRCVFLMFFQGSGVLVALCVLLLRMTLHSDADDAVLAELSFLDIAMNYGQGFMTLMIFGIGADLVMPVYRAMRCARRFTRRLMCGAEDVVGITALAAGGDEPEEGMEYLALSNVAAQCKLFAPFITACAVAICQDRRYRFSVYRKVFYGEELVSWLMDGKLVRTREDGVKFGRQLMAGGVIEHVSQEHNFYDNNRFFYRFPPAVLAMDVDYQAESGETPADDESDEEQ